MSSESGTWIKIDRELGEQIIPQRIYRVGTIMFDFARGNSKLN